MSGKFSPTPLYQQHRPELLRKDGFMFAVWSSAARFDMLWIKRCSSVYLSNNNGYFSYCCLSLFF